MIHSHQWIILSLTAKPLPPCARFQLFTPSSEVLRRKHLFCRCHALENAALQSCWWQKPSGGAWTTICALSQFELILNMQIEEKIVQDEDTGNFVFFLLISPVVFSDDFPHTKENFFMSFEKFLVDGRNSLCLLRSKIWSAFKKWKEIQPEKIKNIQRGMTFWRKELWNLISLFPGAALTKGWKWSPRKRHGIRPCTLCSKWRRMRSASTLMWFLTRFLAFLMTLLIEALQVQKIIQAIQAINYADFSRPKTLIG